MKFGAASYIWTDSFGAEHFSVLPRLKENGLDGIEFGILSPATFPAAAVRKELQRNGLECTACSALPRDASLASPDSADRQRGRAFIEECLKACAEVGSRVFAGPMYSPVGFFTGKRRTTDEWKRTVESWQEIAPVAASLGIQIALEPLNRFETYFLNTVADAAALCDEIANPNVGILVDTFHANIEEKSIGAALRRAGKHLKHIHACENDRGTPGSGNVGWPEFFSTVRAIGYDGWMVIESFGFSIGAMSAAASIWRDLAATPQAIAFDGVRFLREKTAAKA